MGVFMNAQSDTLIMVMEDVWNQSTLRFVQQESINKEVPALISVLKATMQTILISFVRDAPMAANCVWALHSALIANQAIPYKTLSVSPECHVNLVIFNSKENAIKGAPQEHTQLAKAVQQSVPMTPISGIPIAMPHAQLPTIHNSLVLKNAPMDIGQKDTIANTNDPQNN